MKDESPSSPAVSTARAPGPVVMAVRLMFAGAGIGLVSVIVLIADKSSLRDAIRDMNVGKTAADIDSMTDRAVTVGVVFGLLFVVLYALLAIQVGKAKNWARITTWVFAGIGVLIAVAINAQTLAASSKVLMVVSGAVDLAIFLLLARKASNGYFRAEPVDAG